MINWFNLDQLKPIVNLGSASSTVPSKISINLSCHQCWELVTERNDTNILQHFSTTDDEEKIFRLEAEDVALIDGPRISKEEQHATEQIAEQVIPDGASALTRPQQGNNDQINGVSNPTQNFENSIPPSQIHLIDIFFIYFWNIS